MKTTTRSAIVRKAALASCEENDGMDIAFVNELVVSDIHNAAWFKAKEAQAWFAANELGSNYDDMCFEWLNLNKDKLPKGKEDDYRPIAREAARAALNMGICPDIVRVFFSEVQVQFSDMTVCSILARYINN